MYIKMYLFEYLKEPQLISKEPQIRFFEIDTIHIKKTISFDQVSEMTRINLELIQFLNPSFKLDIISYIKEKNYAINLPRKKISFLEKEKKEASKDNSKRYI